MRRFSAVVVASLLVLAACGDDSGSGDSATSSSAPADVTSSASTSPTTAPAASGTTAVVGPVITPTTTPRPTLPKPSVAPATTEPTELVITDLTEGTGEPAADGDQLILHYVGVRSVDGVEFDNSYERGTPFVIRLGAGRVIKGWDQGLVGVKAGGQRRLDIPSDLAYGSTERSDVIRADEDLTFVVDVLAVVKEPQGDVAPSVAVPEVVPDDLVEGFGVTATAGSTATFVYVFYRGDTGARLFSSWTQDPATIRLTPDGSIDALIEGMIGMKEGGRRQVTIPSSMVFGGQGNAEMGLPAGTDLVMMVDLLTVQ